MSEPCVIVTGAGGFIGGNLVLRSRARGWRVRALVRRIPAQKLEGVDYFTYDIGGRPPEKAFRGARFLVHCAYVRHDEARDSDRLNVEGARVLVALCRTWDIKPVLLSSFSAHEGAQSHYGRMKREAEGLFEPKRDLILRPGLVVGRGGLFGIMAAFAFRRNFIPLVGSGNQPVQIIAVDDLCLVIERGLDRGICGTYWIAHPIPTTLRAILESVVSQRGRRPRFIEIPECLLLLACRVAKIFRIPLAVSSDNILGLRQVSAIETTRDLAAFGVEPKGFDACIAEMAQAPGLATLPDTADS
jgi:nucleoside-diphosphate-sugar epimerase